jgi:hypothetical protein
MINPKFYTIYNYQKEIFSIIISSSNPTLEIPTLNFTSFLSQNFSLDTQTKAYKYSPLNNSILTKYGVVNDFESYLLNCSSEVSSATNPCIGFSYILASQQGIGTYFNQSSSFYSRCSVSQLQTNIYNNVNQIQELTCVYENGVVSSAYFIKDLSIWKHEYVDYYLCFQTDISNKINSVLDFNKFNDDINQISSARILGGYYLIHSFLKGSDYNRKNIILKSQDLLKQYHPLFASLNYKVVDYSISPVGDMILQGNNGGNLNIKYFNSIKFYTASEINNFNISFGNRPAYLKAEESKYYDFYDLKSETSSPIFLPPAKVDSKGFPVKRYVKITKLSPETRSTLIKRNINLDKITEIIPNNFSYPFSAIAATKIDSRSMSSLPARSFDCKLKKILIPSNYFPFDNLGRDLRYSQGRGSNVIYKGVWDGTFKLGWTDNPAWILLDLLINKRYGLGNYIESDQIDIWELYQIAKWCDACDENGIFWGVPDTFSGYEPRYSFNALINEKYNVYDMINNIMSLFNGNVYYSNSIISFDDNRLKDISGTIASTDVLDGIFNFGNLKKDDEFTVIEVTYLDKRDFYKPKIEYVEDSEAIRKRGILKKQISPMGITSRGQAIRYAKNILFQTAKESSNVSFSIDSKILAYGVGDLIKLSTDMEDRKQFGKILDVSTVCALPFNEVRLFLDTCLDSRFFDTTKMDVLFRKQFNDGNNSYFDVEKCTYFIKSFQTLSDSFTICGTYVTLHNSGISCANKNINRNDIYYNECSFSLVRQNICALSFNENSIYSLRLKDKKDKVYKINSIIENSASEFSVFATEFCTTKFDIIEGESPKDINTDNYFYIANSDASVISRPQSVFFSKVEKVNINSTTIAIKATWKAAVNVIGYNLYIIRPNSDIQVLTRTVTGTTPIFSNAIRIFEFNSVTKEYSFYFLQPINSVGTFKVGIESFVLEYNNTSRRTSEMTTKTITI